MLSSYKNQQVYIQVVDKSSITKAADTLAMSKSSVSRILSLIENEWGVQLLIRSTRNISVTSAGEAVYYHYKKTIKDAKQTIKTVESSIEIPHSCLPGNTPSIFTPIYALKKAPRSMKWRGHYFLVRSKHLLTYSLPKKTHKRFLSILMTPVFTTTQGWKQLMRWPNDMHALGKRYIYATSAKNAASCLKKQETCSRSI